MGPVGGLAQPVRHGSQKGSDGHRSAEGQRPPVKPEYPQAVCEAHQNKACCERSSKPEAAPEWMGTHRITSEEVFPMRGRMMHAKKDAKTSASLDYVPI